MYSQSHIATNLSIAISRICLDEGLVLLNKHLTLQIYYVFRSAFEKHEDDTGRSNFTANQHVLCLHTSNLPKFIWQPFYFVYFCLAEHLSNSAGIYLPWSRISSPLKPDQYFIFTTPVYDDMLTKRTDLNNLS